ncbi:MAG: phosphatidate cytidylyltransferase [Oscillospiraceae bacterium]|nr:phosphatidate cytidylyltransferase [Oscillospiraceae bacterium]
MKKRVISAIVMLAIVGACLFISGVTRALLVLAAAVLSAFEMKNCLAKSGEKAIVFTPLLYIVINIVLCLTGAPLWAIAVNFIACAVLTVCICICREDLMAPAARGTLFMLVYPMALYAALQRILTTGRWLYVFAVAALGTWSCDAFALFGGRRFGRHKLSPHVSPNKTVEGSLCGAAASAVFGVLAWFLLKDQGAELWVCVTVAVVASTMGQFGDLAASLFKRESGIKDYSDLIPGHGGMMDRADSLLFSIPTAWFCLEIIDLIRGKA